MAEILIADDDPAVRKVYAELLRQEGHTIREAVDGQAVIRAVEESPPDLIILDLMMPDVSGYDVLPYLRERFKDGCAPPCMVVSGTLTEEWKAYLVSEGVNVFLEKPVDLDRLKQVVGAFLGQRR